MKNISGKRLLLVIIAGAFIMLTSTCKKDETEVPVLSTTIVRNITNTAATSGGLITSSGGSFITVFGVCWSTHANPTISDNKTTDGSGICSFESRITGLEPNTKYYIRAYATNRYGTGYGNETILVTTNTMPVLITATVSNIGYTTATSGGEISDSCYAITACGVCWSKDMFPTINDSKTTDSIGAGLFKSHIAGLEVNTEYHVRAYVFNSITTLYGDDLTFTTSKEGDVGYAVGDSGTILKTNNGGNTWTLLLGGKTYSIQSVYFTDVNTGCVGARVSSKDWVGGFILKTTSGDTTWIISEASIGSCTSVYFTDAMTGYAVGHSWRFNSPPQTFIVKTTDGGFTWTEIFRESGYELSSVYFTDTNTGYAVGGYWDTGGIILKTTDGGTTWTALSSGNTARLFSVFFTDANTGYAVGDGGTILKTTDAGATWTSLLSGITAWLNSVFFTDANTGYAVGAGGTILKTSNGGITWNPLLTGISNLLSSVYLTDATTGYVVGEGGLILKTIDGGTTWTALTSGTTETLNSVFFIKSK